MLAAEIIDFGLQGMRGPLARKLLVRSLDPDDVAQKRGIWRFFRR